MRRRVFPPSGASVWSWIQWACRMYLLVVLFLAPITLFLWMAWTGQLNRPR